MHLRTKPAPDVTDVPGATDIDVQGLSAAAWRIRDPRFPEQDARALIGFIEAKEDDVRGDADGPRLPVVHLSHDAGRDRALCTGVPTGDSAQHVLSWMPSHV